jgi:hypothetical protein
MVWIIKEKNEKLSVGPGLKVLFVVGSHYILAKDA